MTSPRPPAAFLPHDAPLPRAARVLLTGPAGCGKTWRALDAVREAATREAPHGRAAEAPGGALLVLPTYAQVLHVQRIALSRWEARGLLDDVFTTFTGAGERFLPRFRVGALPSAETRDRLLVAALADVDAPAFRAVAGAAAFRARVLRLVKELKQGGLEPVEAADRLAGALSAVGAAARGRMEAFLAVFRAYHARLAAASLGDHEDALRALARALDDEPPQAPPAALVVDGFEDLTPIEQRILDRLAAIVADAGGRVVVTCPYDPARPELFQATAAWRQHLLAHGFEEVRTAPRPGARPAPLARLAADLFRAGDEALPTPGGVHAAWLLGGDDEDEAEVVARQLRRAVLEGSIRTGGRPLRWHDTAIVLRDTVRDGARFLRALERLGVPVRTAGAASALGRTPWVRALRGALDVLGGATASGAFDAFGVHAWLAWCATADEDAAARSARETWEVEHRRDGAPTTWEAFQRAAPDALTPWIARLEAARASLAGATGPTTFEVLGDVVPGLAPLPRPRGRDERGRPRDPAHDAQLAGAAAARARLAGVLGDLAAAAVRTGVGPASAAEAIADVLAQADTLAFAPRDRRLDAVTVLDMETARYWEPALVVVAGLEAGRVPRRPREDILLADEDRDALAGHDPALRLPRARDREVRERRLLYTALTAAREVLWLSRPTLDARGEALPPAFPLRALARCIEPTLLHAASGPGLLAPAAGLAACEGDLVRLALLPSTPASVARGLEEALPQIGRVRRRAAAQRRAAYGGAEVLGPRLGRAVEVVSPSDLDLAHLCRARFVFGRVLRLPEDDLSFEPRGLEYADEGRLLHAAFRDALCRPSASPEEVAEAALAAAEVDPHEEPLLRAEVIRAVDLLRRREAGTPGPLRPWIRWLERGFGPPDEEVRLGEGEGAFLLRGRVDRVDRGEGVPRAPVVIVDYKRAAGSVDASAKSDREGANLQLRLYAAALEALEPVRVIGLEWYASLARRRRIVGDEAEAAHLEARREGAPLLLLDGALFASHRQQAVEAASAAVQDIRRGHITRAPLEATACAECPFRRPCRADADAVQRAAQARVPASALVASTLGTP